MPKRKTLFRLHISKQAIPALILAILFLSAIAVTIPLLSPVASNPTTPALSTKPVANRR